MAYAWANLAASADSPHPKAADERDAMKQYMPNNLIAEGQRLAREWKRGSALGKSNLKPVEVAPLVVVRIPLIADTHSRLIADSVPCDRGHPGWGA